MCKQVNLPGSGAGGSWAPNSDVYVDQKGLVIKVELAGIRRDDLSVVIEENRLLIQGSREDGCRGPNCKFLVMEINYGAFGCAFAIPPGYDVRKAKASYQNGFLRVDIPPSTEPRAGGRQTLVSIT